MPRTDHTIVIIAINASIPQSYSFSAGYTTDSKENFETLDGEDANISDFADFAGGEQLDVAPTAVVVVTEGDAVVELQD